MEVHKERDFACLLIVLIFWFSLNFRQNLGRDFDTVSL